MKKLSLYIFIGSWLLGLFNWQVVHLTRWTHPEWKDWMHAHENQYAAVENIVRYGLCPPCAALEPVFYDALMSVEASREEQNALRHAPPPNRFGFYHLAERGTSWTFVSWSAWALYWTPFTLIWWQFAKRF